MRTFVNSSGVCKKILYFACYLHKMRVSSFLLLFFIVITAGCSKTNEAGQDATATSAKSDATVSSQPLPQGKKNFSVTMGNFDNIGRTWVRIINWTFNETTGTVGGTSWTWFSDVKAGKAIFNDHFCTLDGSSSTCNVYAPAGWSTQSTPIHQNWSGTYTYNSTTGRLDIDWNTIDGVSTPATEAWTVTLPETGLARINLITSNYTLTHGRGYGSNAAWTTFKTISQIVNAGLPSYTGNNAGKNIRANGSSTTGTVTIYPTQTSPGLWAPAAFVLTGMTTPSSPNPKTTLHRYDSGATGCSSPSSCTTTRTGSVAHFAVTGTNRQVAYDVWCACLPQASDWPCYNANMHPMALMQIIDDGGTLKGFVGVETQNPPESSYNGAFQFQCVDYSNIP